MLTKLLAELIISSAVSFKDSAVAVTCFTVLATFLAVSVNLFVTFSETSSTFLVMLLDAFKTLLDTFVTASFTLSPTVTMVFPVFLTTDAADLITLLAYVFEFNILMSSSNINSPSISSFIFH